jgi:hypothetical protein
MKARLVKGLQRMSAYDSAFDTPLVDEIARAATYVKRGERYLDDPNCSPETYAAISDGIAKQAARMRGAIKDLAANRKERLKAQSASKLAADIKNLIDKVVREG